MRSKTRDLRRANVVFGSDAHLISLLQEDEEGQGEVGERARRGSGRVSFESRKSGARLCQGKNRGRTQQSSLCRDAQHVRSAWSEK